MAGDAAQKKIMPNNPEAEKSVVGSMIMDADAILTAGEIVKGEDFYIPQFGVLFDTLVELNNDGLPVDLVTLRNRIEERGAMADVLTTELLRNILDTVPTSANVRYYAQIVKEKAVLRRLIRAAEEIALSGYNGEEALDDLLANAEKQVFDVVQNRTTSDFVPIRTLVTEALEGIEEAGKHQGSVTGVPTGFYDLDYKTAGLQPSDLILVAARPSMGKTAFVLNIAEYTSIKNHIPTVVFSLEMSKDQLVRRMLAMNSRVDSQAIRTGSLKDEEWTKLMEGGKNVGSSSLIIDDTPGINIPILRSKCRKYKMEHGIQLVIIDYLQLMEGSRRAESRQQEISEISRSLKALARELKVPVVALSQLSRAVEQRPEKRPMLSDLRESGAIEQDADIVMFLYRDDYYNIDTEEPGVAEIIIGKQRNGPTGTVKLAWQAQYTKFANLERQP